MIVFKTVILILINVGKIFHSQGETVFSICPVKADQNLYSRYYTKLFLIKDFS